jgi:hypothetical protein
VRAAADHLEAATPAATSRPAAKNRTEADSMLIYVATHLEPVLIGARGVLLRLQSEMTHAAKTMD